MNGYRTEVPEPALLEQVWSENITFGVNRSAAFTVISENGDGWRASSGDLRSESWSGQGTRLASRLGGRSSWCVKELLGTAVVEPGTVEQSSSKYAASSLRWASSTKVEESLHQDFDQCRHHLDAETKYVHALHTSGKRSRSGNLAQRQDDQDVLRVTRVDADLQDQNALRSWRGGETGCGRSQINHKMCNRREHDQKQQRKPPPIRTWGATFQWGKEHPCTQEETTDGERRGRVRKGGETQWRISTSSTRTLGIFRRHFFELGGLDANRSRCEGDLLSKKICGSCQRFRFCSRHRFRSQDGMGRVDTSWVR